jgi:hypothetical protein
MLQEFADVVIIADSNLVILNGGEADVRDRTTAGRFDVVDGNVQGVCSMPDLGDRIAASHASYSPSEGCRPSQDDFFEMTAAISLSKCRSASLA